MDPRWKHPFSALIAGPTCCGKSQFLNVYLSPVKTSSTAFLKISSGVMVSISSLMIPDVHCVQGVPSDLESMINPSKKNLVVIDDLMQELSNDPRITSLFVYQRLSSPKLECYLYSTKHFSPGQGTEGYEFKLPLFGFVQISTRY